LIFECVFNAPCWYIESISNASYNAIRQLLSAWGALTAIYLTMCSFNEAMMTDSQSPKSANTTTDKDPSTQVTAGSAVDAVKPQTSAPAATAQAASVSKVSAVTADAAASKVPTVKESPSTETPVKKPSVKEAVSKPAPGQRPSSTVSGSASNGNVKSPNTGVIWVIALVAFFIAVLSAGGALMVWRQLDTVRLDAQLRSDAVLVQTKTAGAQAGAAEQLAQALQARMSLAEAKLSELNLQRMQLEELMLSVSRSRDDTLVQDLESSMRFAVQQSNLMGSPNALIATLQAGIERINRSAQPRLNPVLQAMEADLVRLQEVAGTDVPMLVAQLAALPTYIDRLPMRSMAPPPLNRTIEPAGDQPANEANNAGNASTAGADAGNSAAQVALDTDPTAANSPLVGDNWAVNAWYSARAQAAGFWQRWSGTAGAYISSLVRVRNIDNSDTFLLSPEHAWVLRENLKLRVLNARLALVGAQHDVASQDLAAVALSVSRFGSPGAVEVQALLEKLQSAQASIQGLQVPMPQSTLGALATAAAGR
jgi:uroporphyrin-3 C-methyltransferase